MRVNNSPNFGARIVIKNRGFQKLSGSARDAGQLSSLSSALPSASVMDTAFFPADGALERGIAHRTSNILGNISDGSASLCHRSLFSNTKKYTPQDIEYASTGFASVSTGLGSYAVPISNTAGAHIISNDSALNAALSTAGSASNMVGSAVLKDNPIGAKFIKKIPD